MGGQVSDVEEQWIGKLVVNRHLLGDYDKVIWRILELHEQDSFNSDAKLHAAVLPPGMTWTEFDRAFTKCNGTRETWDYQSSLVQVPEMLVFAQISAMEEEPDL